MVKVQAVMTIVRGKKATQSPESHCRKRGRRFAPWRGDYQHHRESQGWIFDAPRKIFTKAK